MPVVISMLRGINLMRNKRIKMDALCAIYKSARLEDPRSHVQSGNVIFRTKESNLASLGSKIQGAIERKAGFRCEVILRTPDELRRAIVNNPFCGRRNLDPSKLLVTFFGGNLNAEARAKILALEANPEELHLVGRELYIYFPKGIGQSKLPWSSLEKKIGIANTARNWNTVTKMLAIAEEMETAI